MKEQIIKQASEDFLVYGFKSFTMDDLAHKVGISKRTLYEIFPSKNDLVETCINYFLEHIKENRCFFEGEGNVIENWFASQDVFIERFKITSLRPLWELKKYYSKISEKLDVQFRAFDDKQVEGLIKRGQAEGLFREDIDVKYTKSFFYGLGKMRENPAIFPEAEFPFRELVTKMVVSFLRILVNEKGYKELERVLAKRNN